MEEKDIEEVSRIEEETFSMPWSPKSFQEMIQRDNVFYIVAEEDGKILGSCGVIQALDEGDITNVVVAKGSRGKGIGTRMLSYMKAGQRHLVSPSVSYILDYSSIF